MDLAVAASSWSGIGTCGSINRESSISVPSKMCLFEDRTFMLLVWNGPG